MEAREMHDEAGPPAALSKTESRDENELENAVRALIAQGAPRCAVWSLVSRSAAFERLLRSSAASLWAKRGQAFQSQFDCEDLQQAAMKILYARHARDGEFPWQPIAPLNNWLSRVVRVACLEAWRELARPPHSTFEDGENVVAPQVAHEQLIDLYEAINTLPEPHRTVMARLCDGIEQQDIAAELDLSKARISQLKVVAIAKLRQNLGPQFKEDREDDQ